MNQEYWKKKGRAKEYGDRRASPFVTDFFRDQYPSSSPESTENIKAIDIGCGGGRHTEFLSSLGFSTIAVDKYIKMLDFTKERLSSANLRANLVLAEMSEIPINSGTVDYAISNGVLHNAENVVQIQKAFNEIARILKPGGILLLNLFTSDMISSELNLTKLDNTWTTADDIPMVLLSPEEIVNLWASLSLFPVADAQKKIVSVETGKRSVYKTILQKTG